MGDDRKFFRTKITIEVLSEGEPVPGDMGIEQITYEIIEGSWSGRVYTNSIEELTPSEMEEALIEQGSDPEFMDLGTCLDEEEI